MSERMDVVTFKETKGGKFFAVRLGSATPNKNGDGWNLYLDAMPAPQDGQFRLSIVKPREQQGSKPAGGKAPEIDDSVPF